MQGIFKVYLLFMFIFIVDADLEGIKCKWDLHNCGHEEIICTPEEGIYLDSKEIDIENKDHCFAINDDYKGEFENYEIEAEMLSLESIEGMNSGTVGLMFNYQDPMNYDFMYLQ